MLSTFVIGLREGLEAALIVGIVAAFLRTNGRLDLLRWVWAGVAAAVVLCLGVGIALRVASQNLPYRQQEGLETVIALVAVAMVSYMVVWMRRHARSLKHDLEGAAGAALDSGSGWALVAMAFLAVLREGFETAVFLVAAFNESANPTTAATGALIGILVACVLGYGIYSGGFRINLARFFRITGAVLVLVAAGLVTSAFHSAHEAGWIDAGQRQVADLTWLVRPGSVQSSLLTGMLGWQPRPTVIEVVVYVAFLVPVMTFVLWPAARPFPRRAAHRRRGGHARGRRDRRGRAGRREARPAGGPDGGGHRHRRRDAHRHGRRAPRRPGDVPCQWTGRRRGDRVRGDRGRDRRGGRPRRRRVPVRTRRDRRRRPAGHAGPGGRAERWSPAPRRQRHQRSRAGDAAHVDPQHGHAVARRRDRPPARRGGRHRDALGGRPVRGVAARSAPTSRPRLPPPTPAAPPRPRSPPLEARRGRAGRRGRHLVDDLRSRSPCSRCSRSPCSC